MNETVAMRTVTIVDYGMGNLRSVQKAFETCGSGARLSRDASEIRNADALVVPGVGSFGDCVENLERFGLRDAIDDFLRSGRPYLGICLGLHLLFGSSEESESRTGLGILPGRVRRFEGAMKIPHMGWNTISKVSASPLFRGIEDGSHVYFVHSYYPEPEDREIVAAETEYGAVFASAVWKGNIMATQFHPEKSQRVGLRMVRNFIDHVDKKQ